MSSRKKSTSTEESSSGSSSGSSSTSGSSTGSETGSTSSDSESSSSGDEKVPPGNSRSNDPSTSADKAPRRRSSETKSKTDEKINSATNAQKSKLQVNRGQRLSKSSVYSSDEDVSPAKKPLNKSSATSDRRKISETRKSTHVPAAPPPIGGGKAPPAVVKQQQQQNFAKAAANRQNLIRAQSKPQPKSAQSKKKSIFSPENSSDSGDDDDKKGSKVTASRAKPIPKPKPKAAPQRKPGSVKKEESKSTGSSECSSSASGSTSSSESEETESSEDDSSPPAKRPAQRKIVAKPAKATDTGKTVILSDSEGDPVKAPAIRKLTRSSSTRKSKHLTGKASDSESEVDLEKRSISKSPVKKAAISTTKSKAKVKRDIKATTPARSAISPVPEEQKCPVPGCDSSGHLSGNLEKHFLPEACPVFHNMTAVECKDRAEERRVRDEERKKMIAAFDPTKKVVTPEQKASLMSIREMRSKFKPPPPPEKNKAEKGDREKEPNLVGFVPDYDLKLFQEAQAIASEKVEKEVKDLPVGKGIKYITMGKYQMKVWYQSPYPEDAARLPKMYICEYCLRYQKSEVGMKRHAEKCVWRHPPGDEIYRKGKLQVWQVDGKRHKQYCQHLCLLAKFFLDHKTLYYDVEPFLFYVMTLFDSEGCHTVGYFSKEKNSFLNYNVSCILTLPPYQRKGYGRLLIDFSYLLTRVEGKIGSPEKPLSDLGLISYRSYWKDVLLDYLCKRTGTTLSIKDVSQEMAIYSYDIVSTLQALGMMKYWKGKHIVLKKQDVLEEFEERVKRRGNFPKIDPTCLRWSPFVPPQSSGSS